jgi:hypothetical protein
MEEKDIKPKVIHIDDEELIETGELCLPAPEAGKAWKRKYDGLVFYGAVYLGKRFVSYTGKQLKTPAYETPEDFELVDEPITEM